MNDDFKLHTQDQGQDIPAPAGTPVREGERLPDPPPGRSRREGDQDERISSYTARRRARTDSYGSGREIELTATATLLDAEQLAEHELDPERPWAIILSGTETTYGPGSAVLNQNSAQWDPDGEWRTDMRATMPTEFECRSLVELMVTDYLDEHGDENWSER